MKPPGKKTCCGGRFLFLLLIAALLAPPPCAGEEYRNTADGILSMSYSEGRLSLETRDAPLEKVLQELSRLAEVNIVSDGPMEDRVTVYMDKLPADVAAKKVLRGKDLSFIYRSTAPGDPAGEYRLDEIRVYVSQGSQGGKEQTFSYDRSRKQTREEKKAAIRARNARRAESRAQARVKRSRTPRDDSGSEADQFLSGLLGGNLGALDEIADRLREENPEAREQIDQFLETLEEAKARAAESGTDIPMEGMGNMGAIMQKMLGGKNR